LSAAKPFVKLISELVKRKDCNQLYVQKGELSLRLEKRATASATRSEP
jgi:hypothetical protein